MDETTLRIFKTMLTLIEDYRDNKIDLRWLVNSLEGSINTLEEIMSKEFFMGWHKHWNKLEVVLALGRDDEVDYILTELKSLETLIDNMIKNFQTHD